MIIQYMLSCPEGDINLGSDQLSLPFKLTPSKIHPSMTLGDYFEAIKKVLFKDDFLGINNLLKMHPKSRNRPENILKILIKTEKHGALSHVASLEILTENDSFKFVVSTELPINNSSWLTHEFALLKNLRKDFKLPYFPQPFMLGEVVCHSGINQQRLIMLFSEWFEDYHEWHLALNAEGMTVVYLWDQIRGHHFVSLEEAFKIIRQISEILTLYYNPFTYHQICKWHHAAGDFAVSCRNGDVDVKLTTIRRYESIMPLISEDEPDPIIAGIYFFLNLTIKIRLDKTDGVGDFIWADSFILEAAIKGFFDALNIIEQKGQHFAENAKKFLLLLKSFDKNELFQLLESLLPLYQECPEDFKAIQDRLRDHGTELFEIIQNVQL